jgi:predicted  nucleic acid-binding Zn-ribbon protein
MLQQRIGELEAKIQTMIALPDYNKEKQQAIEEKKMLEEKLARLTSKVKEQETKTYVVIIFAIIFIIIARYFYVKNVQ